MSSSTETMEKIVALCRRRGFIFGSSEIYGGIGGFWDYGPLGCELKKNIKDCWWNDMVRNPPPGPNGTEYQMVGVDCSIIMNPKVWEASGHVGGFQDPMVACKAEGCRKLFRADQAWLVGFYSRDDFNRLQDHDRELVDRIAPLLKKSDKELSELADDEGLSDDFLLQLNESIFEVKTGMSARLPTITIGVEAGNQVEAMNTAASRLTRHQRDKQLHTLNIRKAYSLAEAPKDWPRRCPVCNATGTLTEPREFNLMFETNIGALQDSTSKAYLRPETAQGIFANFKNVMDSTRVKIPFGIAQIGKAFRNEINPRNYTFRSREFEQMEIEFFCWPDTSMMWYEFWRDVRIKWYESLGIHSDKLRPREQGDDELAHYSDACTDIEYLFPFSEETQELEGVAHRGDFDLSAHGKASKGKENAFAVVNDETKERLVPHVIEPSAGVDRFTLAAITEAYSFDENRASPEFMKFHPRLAPIKAAVFPLVAKDGMPDIAEPIYNEIRKHLPCQYDAKQSIGKRYARMDEAGTPFCFTIDGQSKEDGTVTVRNRDDASQDRIDKSRCLEYLRDKLGL